MKILLLSFAIFILSNEAFSNVKVNAKDYDDYDYVLDMYLANRPDKPNPALLSKAFIKNLGGNQVYVYVEVAGDGEYISNTNDNDSWVKYTGIKIKGNGTIEDKEVKAIRESFEFFTNTQSQVTGWEMTFSLESNYDLYTLITSDRFEVHTQVFYENSPQTSGSAPCNGNCFPTHQGPDVPIDGGLGFLLAAGLGYGVFKKRK
jgi:hypothetical protein